LSDSSVATGSAAAKAESDEIQKYGDIVTDVDLVPFAKETSGVWSKEALNLVAEIGRRISDITHARGIQASCGSASRLRSNAATLSASSELFHAQHHPTETCCIELAKIRID